MEYKWVSNILKEEEMKIEIGVQIGYLFNYSKNKVLISKRTKISGDDSRNCSSTRSVAILPLDLQLKLIEVDDMIGKKKC